MSAAGFFTYARYQILLIMTWFINIFFPMSDSCKCPHFCLSSRILFLTFLQFCSRVWLFLLPTRISYNSKTLMNNIFCNITNPLVKSTMSRNISSSLSNHLPQFFILPEFFSNFPPTKNNIIFNDWKTLITSDFLRILKKISWNQVLQLNEDNVNIIFEHYLNFLTKLIKSHFPLKKLNKKKESFNKNHGLLKESKMKLKGKIGSSKGTLNVMIVIRIFYIMNRG